MSDLTNETKKTAEGAIRYNRPVTFLPLGLATLTAFAFMKAAVIAVDDHPVPFLTRATCLRFAHSLEQPPGTQAWIARFGSKHRMSTKVLTSFGNVRSGHWLGYKFYLFTYVVGNLIIQVSIPRWTKRTRRHPDPPFFIQPDYWDLASVPIWPDVASAEWPPPQYLDDQGVKQFRDRFANSMRVRPLE